MGIDVETWRARIGLYHAASVGRHLKKQQRAARAQSLRLVGCLNIGETIHCVPCVNLFTSCVIVLLILNYIFHLISWTGKKCRGWCLCSFSSGMKLCHKVVSAAVHPQRSTLVVALSLLLIIAGDVELNPGPVEDLNLKNLLNILSPVESKWYEIGVQLGIHPSKLQTFELDYRNCGRKFSETLVFWLGGNTDISVTWESIVNALNSPSVNEKGLALKVRDTFYQTTAISVPRDDSLPVAKDKEKSEMSADREKHTHIHQHHDGNVIESQIGSPKSLDISNLPMKGNDNSHRASSDFPGEKNGTASPHDPFPLLEKITDISESERAILKACLRSDSREIMKKFYRLLNTFRQSLRDRHFPLDELIYSLKVLKAYDPVEEVPQEQQKSVFEGHMQQLKNATFINDVFDVIEVYCSFFNYDIIKCMIQEHGTENDKVALQTYIEEFNQYAKRRIYECPSTFTKGKEEGAKLHLKLDSKYECYSVKALEDFQVSLCKILKVSVHALLLRHLEEGCVELNFQIPAFLQQALFPLSVDQETALTELGVLIIATGDYKYAVKDHQVPEFFEEKETSQTCTEVIGSLVPFHDVDMDSALGGTITSYGVTSKVETGTSGIIEDFSLEDLEKAIVYSSREKVVSRVSHTEQEVSKVIELCEAVKNDDLEKVKTLVEVGGCYPLEGTGIGNNALHYAAGGGNLKVLKYFVEEISCNPACMNQNEVGPLHLASCSGHLDIVKYLITDQQVDPLCQDEKKWTPLHNACEGGSLAVVQFLVKEMSKYMPIKDILNEATDCGHTPLHIASQYGHLDIVQFFISELKCDPSLQLVNHGLTPLHFAASGGHIMVVKYLVLEQKCDPMTVDKLQDTPLHYAAYFGQLEVVKFFIEKMHCSPHVEDVHKCTPLQRAVDNNHKHVVRYMQSIS